MSQSRVITKRFHSESNCQSLKFSAWISSNDYSRKTRTTAKDQQFFFSFFRSLIYKQKLVTRRFNQSFCFHFPNIIFFCISFFVVIIHVIIISFTSKVQGWEDSCNILKNPHVGIPYLHSNYFPTVALINKAFQTSEKYVVYLACLKIFPIALSNGNLKFSNKLMFTPKWS